MTTAIERTETVREAGSGSPVPAQPGDAASSTPGVSVRFPYGLPGFPDAIAFELEALEGCEGRFLLLRSLEDPELRLVVMPAPSGQPIVAERHVREACAALGWSRESVALLFVVTLAAGVTGLDAFVNLRAPIFLDTERALAVQVVLSDPAYPFRHPLAKRPAA